MHGPQPLARTTQAVGWLMLAAGVSVFAIRLRHTGPYAFPEQGDRCAGVLALLIGIARAAPGVARATGGAGTLARRLLFVAAPIVLWRRAERRNGDAAARSLSLTKTAVA